jgi:NitT/TauT family transport system substrate-binding protein
MSMRTHLVGLATAAALSAGASQVAIAEPLRIAYGTWVGFGPLFVAQEKGFFAKEGVTVQLIKIDDHTAAFAALFDDQVDGVVAATQDLVTFRASFSGPDEEPLVCVLALDDSQGGDGILATKDIRSIADLKGKSVAFWRNSAAHFYLNVLLEEAGLSEADIEVVDLPSDDATTAFMLQEVDAVATYEPFLTQGKNAEHGHLLTDTSERPGLLTDCLAAKSSVFGARMEEFKAVGRAWDGAVGFVAEMPDEANEIMARNLGDWLEDPAVLADILEGIKFYDAQGNREYFGTAEKPGPIYRTMQHAIDVWSSAGVLDQEAAPADFIAHGVWDD